MTRPRLISCIALVLMPTTLLSGCRAWGLAKTHPVEKVLQDSIPPAAIKVKLHDGSEIGPLKNLSFIGDSLIVGEWYDRRQRTQKTVAIHVDDIREVKVPPSGIVHGATGLG